jgi:hypothetical protein
MSDAKTAPGSDLAIQLLPEAIDAQQPKTRGLPCCGMVDFGRKYSALDDVTIRYSYVNAHRVISAVGIIATLIFVVGAFCYGVVSYTNWRGSFQTPTIVLSEALETSVALPSFAMFSSCPFRELQFTACLWNDISFPCEQVLTQFAIELYPNVSINVLSFTNKAGLIPLGPWVDSANGSTPYAFEVMWYDRPFESYGNADIDFVVQAECNLSRVFLTFRSSFDIKQENSDASYLRSIASNSPELYVQGGEETIVSGQPQHYNDEHGNSATKWVLTPSTVYAPPPTEAPFTASALFVVDVDSFVIPTYTFVRGTAFYVFLGVVAGACSGFFDIRNVFILVVTIAARVFIVLRG